MMNEERYNERGNKVINKSSIYGDRYAYDLDTCPSKDGWEQFDTEQDAWYFGVWVNKEKLTIITYAEGDEITVTCPDAAHFNAEIKSMCEFYEDGYIATVIDPVAKTSTTYVQDRQQFFIGEGGTHESDCNETEKRREGD